MTTTSNIRQLFPSGGVLLDRKEEKSLVAACLNGDQSAMRALVTHYEKPLYNVAYRMLGNSDDAADATQSTFLKAFQKMGQFNPEFRLFSWIYRIAMNESIDMLRLRQRSEPMLKEHAAVEPGPADIAFTTQLSDELRGALLELSEDYRTVIVYKYFSGLSYEEISDVLDIPPKTIKSRLYSARQSLSIALRKRGCMQ